MTPFLTDVVHMLLSGPPRPWILRVLAGTAQRLALLICQRRQPLGPYARLARDRRSQASAVAAFLAGGWQTWKAPRRRDGFLRDDLGRLLDEDAETETYAEQRRIASSIVMWCRHHLQASNATSRHLAHVAVVHGLTVLSTRLKDLLPHVHDTWQQLAPSFQDAPLSALADGCVLLRHVARLSGDFIQRRFRDVWSSLWRRLRDLPAETDQRSPEQRFQLAALETLTFLAQDSALVRGISKELMCLALKFLAAPGEKLRTLARSLAQCMVRVEPDVAWICLSGACELPEDERQRLQDMLSVEDRQPWRPRVGLGAGGELWASFLQGPQHFEREESDFDSEDDVAAASEKVLSQVRWAGASTSLTASSSSSRPRFRAQMEDFEGQRAQAQAETERRQGPYCLVSAPCEARCLACHSRSPCTRAFGPSSLYDSQSSAALSCNFRPISPLTTACAPANLAEFAAVPGTTSRTGARGCVFFKG